MVACWANCCSMASRMAGTKIDAGSPKSSHSICANGSIILAGSCAFQVNVSTKRRESASSSRRTGTKSSDTSADEAGIVSCRPSRESGKLCPPQATESGVCSRCPEADVADAPRRGRLRRLPLPAADVAAGSERDGIAMPGDGIEEVSKRRFACPAAAGFSNVRARR